MCIRDSIYSVAKEAPGHIAIFAPSYKLLDEFIDSEGWPNRLVIKEKSEWVKSEIDQIIPDLEKYRKNKQKILYENKQIPEKIKKFLPKKTEIHS